MYIKNLSLKNYRNYEDFSTEFTPGINLIIGKNAVGKTNLLEAVYFLENGRSHRTRNYQELIKWHEEFLHVKASVKRTDRDLVIDAMVEKSGGRRLKVNGVLQKGFSGRVRPVQTVMFTPDHLKIVKEMPEHRRAYLDEILEKIKADYAYWRQHYGKVLRQRNLLLKKVGSGRMKPDMIDCWDVQLVEAGAKIIKYRNEAVATIAEHAAQIYSQISDSPERFSLKYENQLVGEDGSVEGLQERFMEGLRAKRRTEIERGQSLLGPHRDDIGMFVGGIDMRTYGSQGEQRSVALALKITEHGIITEKIKEYPVLLLDDVMSELDIKRREALLKYIKNGTQVLITSTNVEYFKEQELCEYNVISVK
ncbi:MAG: DNA replication/repair protein RecF [Candidatus Aquicultor sp.]|nr:DNA replication/repair protein RecF [Candidatus Aquicultor sp.]